MTRVNGALGIRPEQLWPAAWRLRLSRSASTLRRHAKASRSRHQEHTSPSRSARLRKMCIPASRISGSRWPRNTNRSKPESTPMILSANRDMNLSMVSFSVAGWCLYNQIRSRERRRFHTLPATRQRAARCRSGSRGSAPGRVAGRSPAWVAGEARAMIE